MSPITDSTKEPRPPFGAGCAPGMLIMPVPRRAECCAMV
jgi:hypothetical protein